MEYDFSIRFVADDIACVGETVQEDLEVLVPESGMIEIRKEDCESKSLDIAVSTFVSSILSLRSLIVGQNACLRVGAYFDVEAVAFLSFELGEKTIRMLAALDLSLELDAYPCE